jgi:hypothetical protein
MKMPLRSCLSNVFAFTLACATLCTTPVSAQQSKVLAPHKPVPPRVENPKPWPKPATSRSMVGGMWMTDANFKSSIYLKNGIGISPLTVVPILYLSNGTKYTLPSVTLEPAGTAVVNINDALREKGIAPWANLVGYLEVKYNSFYDPLCVVINSVDTVHSLIFTSSLRSAQLPPHAAATHPGHAFEGMWWKEENSVSGFVALSNTTTQAVQASIAVSDGEANSLGTHTVTISPHGTKIVNLDEMQSANTSSGGLRISYDGAEQGLIVNGELEDTSNGYSASMAIRLPLMDSEKPTLSTFAELGLMTGAADPMMSFPAGTEFKPFSVLRNISSGTVTVTPTFYWMAGAAARSAQLKPFSLEPFQTINLDVQSLLATVGMGNFNGTVNLILNLEGKPHSLLMASGSVDRSKNYVFQVVPHAVEEGLAKSLSYWSTDNGNDTMVTLWNPADEGQDFIFTLFFSGGHYDFPIHLEPRATHAFNISEIVQNQVPDKDGSVVPSTVHEGSARIAGPQGEAQHILISMDAGTYNVRKATCTWYCLSCYGYVDSSFGIAPFAVAKSGNYQLNVIGVLYPGTQYNLNSQAQWTSTNTGVASVATGKVNGVAGGSATLGGLAYEPIYSNPCGTDPICESPDEWLGGSGTGTVFDLKITGKNYIFVGNDPSELYGNHYIFSNSSGTQPPQPPGGICCAASSGTSDTVSQTSSNPIIFQFTTLNPSAVVGDRTLTFEYDLSGEGTSQQMGVTAREFAYATNNSPSSTCTLKYGTNRAYVYSVYTHPDHAVVLSTDGISGTAVHESFNPSLSCETITGNGYLNANAQFIDNISSGCSSTPLTCTQTTTQTLSVAGYAVRTNTLQWTSAGVTYTSHGPTQ